MILENYNNITFFCTDRHGGTSSGNYSTLNLSEYTGDDLHNLKNNFDYLSKRLGKMNLNYIVPHQTHETKVLDINKAFMYLNANDQKQLLNGVDALVTSLPNTCIAVTTADCVPLLFWDETKQVVAVAHAGWRGTCMQIAKNTIQKMQSNYNCNPENIQVYIGPSISPSVYEVGNDVITAFKNNGFLLSDICVPNKEKYLLNLWEANIQVILKMGIDRDKIHCSNICTFTDNENYFSARKLGIQSGRILNGIFINDSKF
jgi:YfiH family protein